MAPAGVAPEHDHDGASEPLLDRICGAFLQSARLLADHTPRKIRVPVVFFRARDNAEKDLLLSLEAITSGAIEIEEADACHYSLLDPVSASRIGAVLNRHMSRVIASAA
jgi:hypothetical protein